MARVTVLHKRVHGQGQTVTAAEKRTAYSQKWVLKKKNEQDGSNQVQSRGALLKGLYASAGSNEFWSFSPVDRFNHTGGIW
jgi:hypothetical protein